MRPMLATRGTFVPTGDEWQHEVKWDGMHVYVEVRSGQARLWSRNENDATVSFPELTRIPVGDALLDGEVVAFAEGAPSFGALAERIVSRGIRRFISTSIGTPSILSRPGRSARQLQPGLQSA